MDFLCQLSSSSWFWILALRLQFYSLKDSRSVVSLLIYSQIKVFCSSCLRNVFVISYKSDIPLSSLISQKLCYIFSILFLYISAILIFSLLICIKFLILSLTMGVASEDYVVCLFPAFFIVYLIALEFKYTLFLSSSTSVI